MAMPTTPATTAGTPLKVAAPSFPPLSSSPSFESESLPSPPAAPEELLEGWLLEPDDDLLPPDDEDEGDPDDFEALLDFDDLESDDFELPPADLDLFESSDLDLPESSSDFELPPPPAAAPPEPPDLEPLSSPPFIHESSPLPTGPTGADGLH